jgi:hypothetical protein
MLPRPSDDPHPIIHNDIVENFDFDAFCAIDDADWMVLGHTPSSGLRACSQDSLCQTEGLHTDLPHASHGGEYGWAYMEYGSALNAIFDSSEMEIDAPINDLPNPNDPFQAALLSDASQGDQPFDGHMEPRISTPVSSRGDLSNTARAQQEPFTAFFNQPHLHNTTQTASHSARHQQPIEDSHRKLADPQFDLHISSSSSTLRGHQSTRPFPNPGATWNHDYHLSKIQDPDLELSWSSIDTHPNFHGAASSTTNIIHIPAPQHIHDTSHWPANSGEYSQENFGVQQCWNGSSHTQQPSSQLSFPNTRTSHMNTMAYDYDDTLWARFGSDLARTHSPETTRMIYHESFLSAKDHLQSIDSYGPVRNANRNHSRHGQLKKRFAGSDTSGAYFPFGQEVKGRPNDTRKDFQRKKIIRTVTERGKKAALAVRRGGGACEHCRHTKKGESCNPSFQLETISILTDFFSAPTPSLLLALNARRSQGPRRTWARLSATIGILNRCSRSIPVTFCLIWVACLLTRPDFFGIEQRVNNIRPVLESMHGHKRDLLLGSGLREHSNIICIDFDSSNVRLVSTQSTRVTLRQDWISTHDLKINTGAGAPRDNFIDESYAIVTLPEIADLDNWGRQDIRELAEKWPLNLEAAYDLALLKYSEVNPPLPCVRKSI